MPTLEGADIVWEENQDTNEFSDVQLEPIESVQLEPSENISIEEDPDTVNDDSDRSIQLHEGQTDLSDDNSDDKIDFSSLFDSTDSPGDEPFLRQRPKDQKIPITGKWWFWLIIVAVVIAIVVITWRQIKKKKS